SIPRRWYPAYVDVGRRVPRPVCSPGVVMRARHVGRTIRVPAGNIWGPRAGYVNAKSHGRAAAAVRPADRAGSGQRGGAVSDEVERHELQRLAVEHARDLIV